MGDVKDEFGVELERERKLPVQLPHAVEELQEHRRALARLRFPFELLVHLVLTRTKHPKRVCFWVML